MRVTHNRFNFSLSITARQIGGLTAWLLALCLMCTAFGPPVLTDGAYPSLRLGPDEIAALVAAHRPPAVTAAAALVVDLDSNQTLYALNPDRPLPPASTVKIMTALVVLQQVSVDEMVTISYNAAAMPGSRMGLAAPERLTVRDLLYGLLLPSGNDAAVALAEYVAGSEEAFVQLMNHQAAVLGLRTTSFANVHGLDAPGMTTSAADLVMITRAALAYPLFDQIVATPSATVVGRVVTNTNELLGSYPGADGIKTGTTDAAGECLVASVTQAGHRVVAVVLGSADRYRDVRALLDFAAAGWRWGRLDLPADALAWELGPDGKLYRLQADAPPELHLAVWQWRLVQPVRQLAASAMFTGTLPVGEVRWRLGDQVLASSPLVVVQGP